MHRLVFERLIIYVTSASADVTSTTDPTSTHEHGPRRSARIIALFADYDRLRLATYKQRGRRGHRIELTRVGGATALRFGDVGYFNRVYAPDEGVIEQLDRIESFYAGGPFAGVLIGPPGSSQLDEACRKRGWQPADSYAWLAGALPAQRRATASRYVIVRAATESEQRAFLETYLRGFEVEPDRFDAAIDNMRHLFALPQLSFLMVMLDGAPAGIGMLYHDGDTAVLCAGATVPTARKRGCHHALLAARLELAEKLGCTRVVSWAAGGGQSEANMQRSGLQVVGVTRAWRVLAGLR